MNKIPIKLKRIILNNSKLLGDVDHANHAVIASASAITFPMLAGLSTT